MLLGIQGSGQLTAAPPDAGRFRAVAELAEELGYDSIWAGEHLSFHNPILDLGVALAAFAAVTERVLLGAGSCCSRCVIRASSRSRRARSTTCRADGWCSGSAWAARARRTSRRRASTCGSAAPAPTRASPPCARCSRRARRRSQDGFTASTVSRSRPGHPAPGGHRSSSEVAARQRSAVPDASATAGSDTWSRRAGSPPGSRTCARTRTRPAAIPTRSRTCSSRSHASTTTADRAREATRAHLSQRYRMRFEPYHVERLCIAGTPEECAERLGAYAEAGVEHVSFNPAADDDLLEQVAAAARGRRSSRGQAVA